MPQKKMDDDDEVEAESKGSGGEITELSFDGLEVKPTFPQPGDDSKSLEEEKKVQEKERRRTQKKLGKQFFKEQKEKEEILRQSIIAKEMSYIEDKTTKKRKKYSSTSSSTAEPEKDLKLKAKRKKYLRGEAASAKGTKSIRLKRKIKLQEAEIRAAVDEAARAEILLPSGAGYLEAEGVNKTWQFSQAKIKENLDKQSAAKIFDLKLEEYGPYNIDYTRNGVNLLIGGRRGHLSLFNWQQRKLSSEFNVKETIRDIRFLHDQTMFAVAQKNYVYIYDHSGLELHVLKHHKEVNRLEFLPYHFLLASVGKPGILKYQDTSTGENVCELRPRQGEVDVMKQNPNNAIICLGHNNGTVTMWKPYAYEPLVKMLCHKAAILSLSVDKGGNYLVTSGLDGQVKIWDIRTYKSLHSYFTIRPSRTTDISDTGLLALGYGSHLQVWKDAFRLKQKSPYMVQEFPGKEIRSVKFCPLEDVLGVGHSHGFSSIVVPGAGEPNFDTFEADPFENKKRRREATVHRLLDKLQPDMISLDPMIFGVMNKESKILFESDRKAMRDAKFLEDEKSKKLKNLARGRNKSSKRTKRKKANIIDKQRQDQKEALEKAVKDRLKQKKDEERIKAGKPKSALDRFEKS